MDPEAAGREMHRLGEVLIARALERLRDQSLEGFFHPRTRSLIDDAEGHRVADAILRVAYDEHADLIVRGTHGYSARDHSHALLGHVAERVAHLSSVPLLVRAAEQVTKIRRPLNFKRPHSSIRFGLYSA